MKTCSRCRQAKPLSEFNARKESPDGKTPSCKRCISERRKDIRTGKNVSYVGPELTPEQRKHVYTDVIVRMRQQGLTSEYTTNQMLERVGNL